jgi:peptide chain release factor 1
MDSVNQKFFEIFSGLEQKYDELSSYLESVEVMSDNKLYTHYLKQRKVIEELVIGFKKYKKIEQEITEFEELLALESDESVKAQLAQNVAENKQQMQDLFEQLKNIYAESKDKQNQKVKVEINSPEKTDFVYEIIKAYAENNSAKIEIQKQTEKSLICYVFGEDIFDELSVLCGNVKVVENTREFDATVVVLDEKIYSAEIDEADIEMKTSKSSGAGGQHINKTESAVKLLHVPTGITVECQDERSQTKNKERAMSLLKEKISQYYLKNNENYIKNQRNTIKNAIFSDTASVIFDFDKHKVIVSKLKKEYDIGSVLDGNLKSIANDMSV